MNLGGPTHDCLERCPSREGGDGCSEGRFYNAGQTCTAVKRLYVHHDIVKEFTIRLRQQVEDFKVGNGMVPGMDMGPLSGRAHLDKVVSFVNTVE